ncbi:hypothetical protein SASPL_109203 [Salvia splendens]|uniref:Uncharacterized protein n=1 Tax=Salvia splendens TaxID=180675 RepID=A0A8X9A7C1_SALSN|nr:hypothetical protein SASPL_109203 [Salvia splendens]
MPHWQWSSEHIAEAQSRQFQGALRHCWDVVNASSGYILVQFLQPTRFRPCHEQPPGWPPPQCLPPSYWPAQRRQHTYEKQQQAHAYRQQHEPVAAHMEPLNRFGYSRPRHQSNPTLVSEHSSYTCTLSDVELQNPDAEYRVRQSNYLPPHPTYTDSYGQPRNSSARYNLWQPEFPLPDRMLHPPTPRSPSYRSSAPPCTALADSPAATTQSRSCHEHPTVVLQPLLGPTSLQRSAIPPMASAAVPPSSSHLPSTRPTTHLVSCEEMHLGVEGDSQGDSSQQKCLDSDDDYEDDRVDSEDRRSYNLTTAGIQPLKVLVQRFMEDKQFGGVGMMPTSGAGA